MNRTWFPRRCESRSLLYDAGLNINSRQRGSAPRDKTWPTIIECGLLGTMLIVALSIIW